MKGKLQTTAALLGGLFLLTVSVQAESAELKERFLQRKPLLEQMKTLEWIGENNLGFLAFRSDAGQSKENAKVVNAENQDRKTIYAEIAVKLNTSAEEVGKRRAVQIAALAAVGHWLQDAEGNWYQKKQ
ncbi:MAG: YdbL family protein [Acidobacteria bacterium]|nr:YdbL family protein [Acidobacteriota bacterium]MBU4405877.1 YdbL family protein [Acidobacteriota bacterium]MCG2811321.1 YdbL family protein [Candidatus Aminicenantes bacterium]